jgi:hypothetical protein
MTVVAFSGADTTTAGAVGSGNGPSGAPNASLTTTRAGSWVWGVGDDFDQAVGRTVGGGQTLFDQYLASVGDTYWVQSQTAPGNPASSPVTLSDAAPTTDHWDLSTIEITPAVVDTQPPTAPTHLSATAPQRPRQTRSPWPGRRRLHESSGDLRRDGRRDHVDVGNDHLDDRHSFELAGLVRDEPS